MQTSINLDQTGSEALTSTAHPLRRAIALALEAMLDANDSFEGRHKVRLRLARAHTLNVVDELTNLVGAAS